MTIRKATTLDELRARIGHLSASLTPRVRDAARYAIEHPNDIALNPVAAVARTSGIAASAFIRMAQAVGFSGYSELRRLFLLGLVYAAGQRRQGARPQPSRARRARRTRDRWTLGAGARVAEAGGQRPH